MSESRADCQKVRNIVREAATSSHHHDDVVASMSMVYPTFCVCVRVCLCVCVCVRVCVCVYPLEKTGNRFFQWSQPHFLLACDSLNGDKKDGL